LEEDRGLIYSFSSFEEISDFIKDNDFSNLDSITLLREPFNSLFNISDSNKGIVMGSFYTYKGEIRLIRGPYRYTLSPLYKSLKQEI